MEKITINKCLAIKKAIIEESPESMEQYNKVLNEIKKSPDLISSLLATEFTIAQTLVVIDLMMWEKNKIEKDLFTKLSIFTTNKIIQ